MINLTNYLLTVKGIANYFQKWLISLCNILRKEVTFLWLQPLICKYLLVSLLTMNMKWFSLNFWTKETILKDIMINIFTISDIFWTNQLID